MHFTIILGSIVILVFGVFGITPALPVLVHFLLIETHPDITAHLIEYCKEENPETPVQYL